MAVYIPDAIGPDERQRQQGNQLGKALGVSEVGILEAKAARFQTAEQRFNVPAPRIIGQGVLGIIGGGQEQQLAIRDVATLFWTVGIKQTMPMTGEHDDE